MAMIKCCWSPHWMSKALTNIVRFCTFVLLLGLLDAVAPADTGSEINLRRTVVVEIVQRTKDAVVLISANKMALRRQPLGFDPFWQQGIGPSIVMRVPAKTLGSGFIIHPDGYVVTNNHVIDQGSDITIELSDGRKLPATLISADPEADLAILKISSPKPFPCLELGDSSDLMIGEPAIAVGNPFGYSHTVSTGIISAIHRDLSGAKGEEGALTDLIQTDAAINPGNSGGPLLNAYGQVIGINTAIRSDAQNIGFAIQVNRLRDLIPELMDPARVAKVDIPLKLAERRTIEPPAHITTEVVSAGASPKVLRSIDDQIPANIVDAYVMLMQAKVGQKIDVAWADGASESIVAAAAAVTPAPDVYAETKKLLGLTVVEMTPELADKYHLNAKDGILVVSVERGSVADLASLQPADVIFALGRYRVTDLSDLAILLPRLQPAGSVRVGFIRGDGYGYSMLQFGDQAQ
jgi:serine protease Do